MTSRPKIGVTTSRRRGSLMWWFNRVSLWRAQARPVRLQAGQPLHLADLDGLVLGGGDDIDASLYGAELRPLVRVDPERDELELNIMKYAVAKRLPVLGTCRGAQVINVYFGGTLHADIHEVYETAPRMRMALPCKTIMIEPNSRLAAIIGRRRDRVNALHHQSIDRLGHELRNVARDEHQIVQVIERSVERPGDPFLVGVQWHPEFMIFDGGQQRLFRALAPAARRHASAGLR